MPRQKDLSRKPVNSFIEVLMPSLKANGEEALLDKINFSMQGFIMRANCHDLQTLASLEKYRSCITDELLKALDVEQIVFRCNPSIALLLTLEEFEKTGKTEFSLEELISEVRKLSSDCSIDVIKNELRELAIDLDANSWNRNKLLLLPDWLRPLREQAPMIQKLSPYKFKLFRKPPVEPVKAVTGKAGKKSKKGIV